MTKPKIYLQFATASDRNISWIRSKLSSFSNIRDPTLDCEHCVDHRTRTVYLTLNVDMPSATPPAPTPDEVDDLIYFARTADLSSLRETIKSLCTAYKCSTTTLLPQCVDVDAEGLGSQSSLLHYPSANGSTEIVQYLLSLLSSEDTAVPSHSDGDNRALATKTISDLLNQKNVSGNTPLHWAALNGHIEVVKLLVGGGADASLQNAMGRDSVVEAELSGKEGAEECAEWMLKNCTGLDRGVGSGVEAEAAAEEVEVNGQMAESESSHG